MSVLIGELKQETATFNPTPTVYDDFQVSSGAALVEAYRDTKTELAGAMRTFAASGVGVVPTMAAAAVSGGPIADACLERLIDEFLRSVDALIASGRHIDGLYVCLHGAMAGEHEGDPEGLLLSELRNRFPRQPIVASLDLHAILTDRMIAATNLLVPYHTYPHTDHFQTGQRAARNLVRLMAGEVKPTVARVRLPMLVRGDELLTATGLFGQAIAACQAIEAAPSGLAAGVIIGNAFTDVPDLRSNVLVTTDNDGPRASEAAEQIGRFMWTHRERFQAQLTSLEVALEQARDTSGLTVFSDAADATASGASGDSNAILAGLLATAFPKRALVPIVDAPAVDRAFQAGLDAVLNVTLGGTRDPGRFEPLPVVARVKRLSTGGFLYEDGTPALSGRIAVLQVQNVTMLVTERPIYVVGRNVFESQGLPPTDFDAVVVKSPNGFRTWYESIAARIIPVDVPGSTSANLRSLPYQNCPRPIFPLDRDVPSPFSS
jgi:microcystin degradation protein MlrC